MARGLLTPQLFRQGSRFASGAGSPSLPSLWASSFSGLPPSAEAPSSFTLGPSLLPPSIITSLL